MGLNPKLLGQGEVEVRHLRTHWKALILPVLLFILLSGLLGVGLALMPQTWRPVGIYVIIGLYVVLLVLTVLLPIARWSSTTYTITNRRVITRRGILVRNGHDLPLRSINNVTYERSLTDRMFGCGTLIFTTAADEPVTLPDVPRVEEVHVEMTEVLFADQPGAE